MRPANATLCSGSCPMADSKVETISRLAQWRIESFGPCSYLKSEPFKLGIWNWYYPLLLFSVFPNSFLVCLVLGLILIRWLIRHFSIEKNRYLYIRLFPEQSRLSKEQPPLARFVLRISSSGNGRQPYISPGMLNLLFTHLLPFDLSPTIGIVSIVSLNYQSKYLSLSRNFPRYIRNKFL